MTRKGSIAYYLAAVVCGSFFFTLAQFIIGRANQGGIGDLARSFIAAFFLESIFGCVPQLLAAFVLRRLASPLRWTEAWHWAVGGAGVFLLVLFALSLLGAGFNRVAGGTRIAPLGQYLFSQAADSLHGGIWQALAAGALTALVLFAVNRAFTREYPAQPASN
ncbi:MAG TPA: hypothetical protein VLV89_10205 [Candidatus Acidoferrum sp.]|nr:hypothetical protein [Candidatus Acidoferrum sp.]